MTMSNRCLATPSRSTGASTSVQPVLEGKVKVESDDDDDESDGFSDHDFLGTPSNRRVIGPHSSTKVRGRTNNSALFSNTAATDSTPSRRRSVRAGTITASETIHKAIQGLKEPSEESEELMEECMDFEAKSKCDVLGVGHTFANQLVLLRKESKNEESEELMEERMNLDNQ